MFLLANLLDYAVSVPTEGELLSLEIKRKIFHLGGLIYLAFYLQLGHPTILYWMLPWSALFVAVETARLRSKPVRCFLEKLFSPIIRSKEANTYTGACWTTLGALSAFLFFGYKPQVVNAAIAYMTIGDAVSAVTGKAWGRHPYFVMGQKRTWEGSLAGFAAALACGWFLGLPPIALILGAAAFSVADNIPLPPNDNLWIPLVTGGVLVLTGL